MNGIPESQKLESVQNAKVLGGIEKRCKKCGKLKLLTEFYLDKTSNDRKRSSCKECMKEYDQEWCIKNKEKMLVYGRQWHIKNREKIKIRKRRWYLKNIEKAREHGRQAGAKRLSTLKGKLNACMSSNIRASLRKTKAGRHWETLVNYTIDQLKKHLEKRFQPGMNWQNYGLYWEIDHKIPIAVFNFDKPEHIDFHLCWALKNLRPLKVEENRRKKAKIDKPFQPSLKIEII